MARSAGILARIASDRASAGVLIVFIMRIVNLNNTSYYFRSRLAGIQEGYGCAAALVIETK
jgi:hypothetical protein